LGQERADPFAVALGILLEAYKGSQMPNSTRQQLEGKLHEVKGDAKQKAGELTNDPALESEGRTEKIAGTVQKTLGELEKLVGK
jgi:uncharacterized protein YjbJ (UPF0337 family)